MYLCQYFFVFIFIFFNTFLYLPFWVCKLDSLRTPGGTPPGDLFRGFVAVIFAGVGSSDHRNTHSTIYFYWWLGFSSFVRPWWVRLVRLISSREFNHSHRFNLFLLVRPVSVWFRFWSFREGHPGQRSPDPRRGIYKPGAAARESGKYPQDIKRIQKRIDIQKCICYTTITRRS